MKWEGWGDLGYIEQSKEKLLKAVKRKWDEDMKMGKKQRKERVTLFKCLVSSANQINWGEGKTVQYWDKILSGQSREPTKSTKIRKAYLKLSKASVMIEEWLGLGLELHSSEANWRRLRTSNSMLAPPYKTLSRKALTNTLVWMKDMGSNMQRWKRKFGKSTTAEFA